MPKPKRPSERITVDKLWGSEWWIVNEAGYCGKLLRIKPGFQCSLHYHPIKHETFYCLTGPVMLQVETEEYELWPTESISIPPNTPHRFWLPEDVLVGNLFEFSTTHSDDDVVRLEESRAI